MPFDPLSTISFVSTAAGLIGFLVSTIPRSEQFIRDIRDCEHKLLWYDSQIATSLLRLQAWREVWCNRGIPYSDKQYECLLGKNGFKEMKTKLAIIQAELDEIGLILYSLSFDTAQSWRKGPACQHWVVWQSQLDELQRMRGKIRPKTKWLSKLCFASFRGANLEERVKRLKEQISDLCEFSKLACWTAQLRDDARDVAPADIRRSIERKANADKLTALLRNLYEQCGQRATWSLILSPPDEEGGPLSIDPGDNQPKDILIEFDVRYRVPAPKEIGIVPFRISEIRKKPIEEYLMELETRTGFLIPTSRSRCVRELLITRRVGHSRSLIIRAALGLVNWTLLLWHTPWTQNICTCRIRFVDIYLKKVRCAAALTPLRTTTSSGRLCDGCVLGSHKALALGVSLAELAIREKIDVSLNSGTPAFFVDNKELTEEHLLRRIEERCPGFRPAVQYCIYFDTKLASKKIVFCSAHIFLLKEQVLDLLEIYYRATKKHERHRRL